MVCAFNKRNVLKIRRFQRMAKINWNYTVNDSRKMNRDNVCSAFYWRYPAGETNLPQIQVNEMRIDNLFLLEDDLIAIIDYESAVKWENHLKYLIYIVRILERYKKDDFETTVRSLRSVAGSLKLCDNPRLKELGYRRMDFFSHRYFMM